MDTASSERYQIEQFAIPCGLRLIYAPMPHSEFVHLALMGKVGRRAEKESEIGAAHFLEHLFFDGTEKRPNTLSLNSFIESVGGRRSGVTNSEIVSYDVATLADDCEAGFDFLSDIFFNSRLTEIEKERKVIGQEIASRRDDPDGLMGRFCLSSLYPAQAIGRVIFDEESALETMNEGVLRGYMDRVYVAENFILVISGNISRSLAEKHAQSYFSQFRSGSEVRFEPARLEDESFVRVMNRDFSQSKLSVSFRGYSLTETEGVGAEILRVVLGGASSSRLFEALRQREHLVYSIFAYNTNYSDTGYFGVQTSMNEGNAQKALDVIMAELEEICKNGISDDELSRAKKILLSRVFWRTEDLGNYTYLLGQQALFSKEIIGVHKRIDLINAVKKEDVLDIARHIFSDKPKVNLITKNNIELRV